MVSIWANAFYQLASQLLMYICSNQVIRLDSADSRSVPRL